jgi:hypothetical protein
MTSTPNLQLPKTNTEIVLGIGDWELGVGDAG